MSMRIGVSSLLVFSITTALLGADCTTTTWHTSATSTWTIECTRVGIGGEPTATFHLVSPATADAFMSTGVDAAAGPAFNIGYAGNSFGRSAGFLNVRPDASAVAPNPSLRFLTANVQRMIITNLGNVGIGTINPIANPNVSQSGLEIASPDMAALWLTGVGGAAATIRGRTMHATNTPSAAGDVFLTIGGLGFDGTSYGSYSKATIHFVAGENWSPTNQGTYITFNTTPNGVVDARTERMRIDPAGNVGINVTNPSEKLAVGGNVSVIGNITATGSITGASVINATYQDIAEWVPASMSMAPGTVVVLNPEHNNEVKPSEEPYDTRVAGVVSANPGVILGRGADTKAMIATTGRVRVRVDATRRAVHVGDLLVTGDSSGTAMVSEPVEINGRKFHQPGTVIGKALEPLDSGRGEVLVLLSLQ